MKLSVLFVSQPRGGNDNENWPCKTDVSKIDVNADLSNPDRRYVVDAKSILGILSLDISHVMNLTIYDEEKNAGKYEKIFEKFGVKDNN